MKLLGIVLIGLALLLAGIFFIFRLIPTDVVTEYHETYSIAQEAGLFERGWLPAIIPSTSKKIKVSNDLDVNMSEGEFYFSAVEARDFLTQLTPISQNNQSICTAKKNQLDGYFGYEFTKDESCWTFFIDPHAGHVLYGMRLVH